MVFSDGYGLSKDSRSPPRGVIGVLNYLGLNELPDTNLTDYVSNVFAITPGQVAPYMEADAE